MKIGEIWIHKHLRELGEVKIKNISIINKIEYICFFNISSKHTNYDYTCAPREWFVENYKKIY